MSGAIGIATHYQVSANNQDGSLGKVFAIPSKAQVTTDIRGRSAHVFRAGKSLVLPIVRSGSLVRNSVR